MCGIVGVAGNILQKDVEVFKLMLFMDTIRGAHSTGIASIPSNLNQDVEVFKRAVPAYDLMEMKPFDRLVNSSKSCLIGHNRFATVGSVNATNAHPFQAGPITGVHNGTIQNKYDLPRGNQFTVDSEAIINGIAELGAKEAIAKIRGAWCLNWYNKDEDTLNLIRNDERPMFIAYTKDHRAVYWSSCQYILRAATAQANVDIDDVLYLQPNMLYTWVLPALNQKMPGYTVVKRVEGAPPFSMATTTVTGGTSKVTGPVTPLTQTTNGTGLVLVEDKSAPEWARIKEARDKNKKLIERFNNLVDNEVVDINEDVPFVDDKLEDINDAIGRLNERIDNKRGKGKKKPTVKGFNKKELDEEQYASAVSEGCIWCSHVPKFPNTVRWNSETNFLCDKHIDGNKNSNYKTEVEAMHEYNRKTVKVFNGE